MATYCFYSYNLSITESSFVVSGYGDKMIKTRKAFTLVEILIATGVLGGFLLGVGSFYISSNKATSKATWRTNTSSNLRRAMKLMQQALDKTSYPAYTDDWNFQENNSDTACHLHFSAGSLASALILTYYAEPSQTAGKGEDSPILSFTTATPIKNLHGVADSSNEGKLIRYNFFFEEPGNEKKMSYYGENGEAVDIYLTKLMYTTEEGTYTYGGGAFTAGTLNKSNPRILVSDVHSITFSEFNQRTKTIQIVVECRDSIDGKHTVVQNLIHMINTAY